MNEFRGIASTSSADSYTICALAFPLSGAEGSDGADSCVQDMHSTHIGFIYMYKESAVEGVL